MKNFTSKSSCGTVSLVALCFVAVLGIALGGYLALCSRAMNLSNRSFHAGLSQQLAELGIEEAMRAINKNDWSDWSSGGITADWSTSGTTATCSLTFPATKFGQAVTGSVKIRVDNYNSNQLNSTWAGGTSYRVDDLVGHNGIWYRCVKDHSGTQTPPNLNYWVPEGIPWKWVSGYGYATEDMVNVSGTWYRSLSNHPGSSSNKPPSSDWKAITAIYTSVPGTYPTEGLLQYNLGNGDGADDWVQLTPPSNWNWIAPVSWRWRSGVTYAFNGVVSYENVWYRCLLSHTSNPAREPTDGTTYWTRVDSLWTWNTAHNYNLNDVVYYGSLSKWYRCIKANNGQAPSDTSAYWSNAPLLATTWNSARQYNDKDTANYNGVWYLSQAASNIGFNPATATSKWHSATDQTYFWNTSTAYTTSSYISYGGVWYRCTTAHTNKPPGNSSYWTALGAPVVYTEGTINIAGSPPLRTQLRASIAPAPLFPNAAGATTTLTISGGTGTIDSYDSLTDSAVAIRGYSAVLAAGNSSGTAVSIGNGTTVQGYVAAVSASSSPYAPLALFGTSAIVKSSTSPAIPTVDLKRISRSPYIPQFDPWPAPNLSTAFSSSTFLRGLRIPDPTTSNSSISLGVPGATTPSIYYYNDNLRLQSGSGSYYQTLNIVGPVILYANGYLRIRTGGMIDIKDTGSAEIHCTDFRTYSGGHGIFNRTLDPKKLIVIADSSATSTMYLDNGSSTTNNDFYGVLYAPNTTAPLGVDVRTGMEIFGAISAREITFSTEANLHYDTSLRSTNFHGVDQPYAIIEWRTLPITEQVSMP